MRLTSVSGTLHCRPDLPIGTAHFRRTPESSRGPPRRGLRSFSAGHGRAAAL